MKVKRYFMYEALNHVVVWYIKTQLYNELIYLLGTDTLASQSKCH